VGDSLRALIESKGEKVRKGKKVGFRNEECKFQVLDRPLGQGSFLWN